MFLLGGGVNGGIYGKPVSLTDLDGGTLRCTTEFRSVYATILDRWINAPADDIVGEHFDPCPASSPDRTHAVARSLRAYASRIVRASRVHRYGV